MVDRVPVAKHKDWNDPATMSDVFRYYSEGLGFSHRAWVLAKVATAIASVSTITAAASLVIIFTRLL